MLRHATSAQRRQLVELLIDRVVVTENRVEIRRAIPTKSDAPHPPFVICVQTIANISSGSIRRLQTDRERWYNRDMRYGDAR